MMYTVRAATVEDSRFLPDIERSSGTLFQQLDDLNLASLTEDDPISSEKHTKYMHEWRARNKGEGGTFVAVQKLPDSTCDPVVGFILSEILQNDDTSSERFMYIVELSVHTSHQRRGLATRLVQCVKNTAVEYGLSGITLTTMRDVAFNKPFYERLGFEEVNSDSVIQGQFGAEATRKWLEELEAFGKKADGSLAARRCWMVWRTSCKREEIP